MSLNRTIYPELVTTYFVSNSAMLSTYTNFLSICQLYVEQVSKSIEYEISNSSSDFVTADASFYLDLNKAYPTFDNEFINYWLKQYNNTITDIKTLVQKDIVGTNFYQQYSDSIGLLTNNICCLDDSTLSLNSSQYPTVYPTSLSNKLSKNTLSVTQQLSQKTTTLYHFHLIYKVLRDHKITLITLHNY
jgi:hypothetical protein